jgi:glycosidase
MLSTDATMRFRFLIPAFLLSFQLAAQTVYPPHWWTGMKNSNLQLMVHKEGVAETDVQIDYPGVRLERTIQLDNPNYVFCDLVITDEAKPGMVPVRFFMEGRPEVIYYELKERQERSLSYGLKGNDFIYLIMPDRFVNGDPGNDIVEGTREQEVNRGYNNKRHGGDLQGVISKLDYLHELGVTATWMTPPLENDQPLYSYHGYAATSHFDIDPRMGNNETYRTYVQESHKRGMKVVFDVVLNHVGDQHPFIQDLPSDDWVNQWEDGFTRTNYRTSSLMDMYASESDRKRMTDGWFDTQMPDLNQRNPQVANYLIQWCIWWIEEMQVDAFRLDTYSYADQDFLSQWAKAINEEYPGFTEFAEVWVNGKAVQGFYNGNNNMVTGVNTHLDGVLDFDLYWGFIHSMTEPFGWEHGTGNLYLRLVQDYIYGPEGGMHNVTFLGNHDINRFYSMAKEDINNYKIGVALLMTMRGTPQWFYGDEVLLTNFANPMDTVRIDFPGGWESDTVNKFTKQGRTADENEAFSYLQTLANWRKANPVFSDGKLLHFVPDDNIYVYFRYNEEAAVMVVVNTAEEDRIITTERYSEVLSAYENGMDVLAGKTVTNLSELNIPTRGVLVLDLR